MRMVLNQGAVFTAVGLAMASTRIVPAHRTPAAGRGSPTFRTQHGICHLEVGLEAALGSDLGLGEGIVVGANGVRGTQFAPQHRPHQANQVQLRLRALDFSPEERDTGAMSLGLPQKLKGIPGAACRPAENADHERRIVVSQFGERVRAVVRHLQE